MVKKLLKKAAILALVAPVLLVAAYATAMYVSVEYAIPMDDALKLVAGSAVLLGALAYDQWRKFS